MTTIFEGSPMTRDEQLIRTALAEAVDAVQSVADNWDCGHPESRLCNCAPLVEQWGFAADEVRAIDPADVLAKMGESDAPAPTRPTFDEVMAVATDDEADVMSAALARFLEANHD